jgi:hypothetical protein
MYVQVNNTETTENTKPQCVQKRSIHFLKFSRISSRFPQHLTLQNYNFHTKPSLVGFEVLTAVSTKMAVFWAVADRTKKTAIFKPSLFTKLFNYSHKMDTNRSFHSLLNKSSKLQFYQNETSVQSCKYKNDEKYSSDSLPTFLSNCF